MSILSCVETEIESKSHLQDFANIYKTYPLISEDELDIDPYKVDDNDIILTEAEVIDLISMLESTSDLSLISNALVTAAKCADVRPAAASLRSIAYLAMNDTFRLGQQGAQAVVNVLRRHSSHAIVALNGCGALLGLLKDPENKSLLVSLGIIFDVVALMKMHATQREDIAGWSTTVILELADDEDLHRTMLGSAGACGAVLDTMVAMAHNDSVTRLCCASIRNLATGHAANSELLEMADVTDKLQYVISCESLSEECRLMASTVVEIILAERQKERIEEVAREQEREERRKRLIEDEELVEPTLPKKDGTGGSGCPADPDPDHFTHPDYPPDPRLSGGANMLYADASSSPSENAKLASRASIRVSDPDALFEDDRKSAVSALSKIKARARAQDQSRAERRAKDGTGTVSSSVRAANQPGASKPIQHTVQGTTTSVGSVPPAHHRTVVGTRHVNRSGSTSISSSGSGSGSASRASPSPRKNIGSTPSKTPKTSTTDAPQPLGSPATSVPAHVNVHAHEERSSPVKLTYANNHSVGGTGLSREPESAPAPVSPEGRVTDRKTSQHQAKMTGGGGPGGDKSSVSINADDHDEGDSSDEESLDTARTLIAKHTEQIAEMDRQQAVANKELTQLKRRVAEKQRQLNLTLERIAAEETSLASLSAAVAAAERKCAEAVAEADRQMTLAKLRLDRCVCVCV